MEEHDHSFFAFGNPSETSNISLYEGTSKRNQDLPLNFFESLIILFLGYLLSHQRVWTGLLRSFNKLIDPVPWLDLINFILSHVWKYVTRTVKFSNLLKNLYQDCTIKVLKYSCKYSLYFSLRL